MNAKHNLTHFRRALLASTVALCGNVDLAFAVDSGDIVFNNGSETISDSINYGTNVIVGESGNAALTINSGATVTGTGAYVGKQEGVTGTVTVTGSGTIWENTSSTSIGHRGTGILTISDGGSVSTDYTTIGNESDSEGTVTVTGSGSSFATPNLAVGYKGRGTLNIENGATVTAYTSFIGVYDGREGLVKVTGSGSTWTNGSFFYLGGFNTSIDPSYIGTGTLTIADGGAVNVGAEQTGGGYGGTVNIAYSASSTGTLNIGAASGQTAVAAGTLNAANLAFGQGSGTLVFNHTDSDYDFSTAMSSNADNTGAINQIAGFTTLSGDSSQFDGTTNVTGGTLDVTGALGGRLYVSNTGTLSGYGDVGTTNILSGGTLSPGGNSPGSLTVNGDLTFESGSTYAVDLSGTEGTSTRSILYGDQTRVTGNATINGGTIAVTALDASTSYLSGKTYTVIAAEGTLSGAFTGVVSRSAFLTTTASYDENNAYLTIAVQDTGSSGTGLFTPVAQTPNQSAVARSLDSLSQSGISLDLHNSMLLLSDDEARTAYQQLSGDSYATAQASFVQTVQTVNNTVNTRMRSITQSVAAPSIAPLGYAEEEKTPKKNNPFSSYEKKEKTFDSQRFSAWSMGFGSWGKVKGTGGGPDTDTGNGGVLFGFDGRVSNAWRVGVMGGYSHSSFDTSTSDGNSDNYHVGVYGTGDWGAVTVRSGLNYAWSDVDNTRQVSLLNQTLKGDYDAGSLSSFAEVGYTIKTAPANFEPFASLSYSRVKTDGFSETGGSAALTVDEQQMNTTFTTIGLRTSKDIKLLGTAAALRGTAGWVHAFGDVDPISTARFATGDSFTVSGTPIDKDAALLEAGLDLNLTPASTFSLGYNGQIGKNAYEHGANAKFRVQF